MNYFKLPFMVALLCLFASSASAEVRNPNPNTTLSIVGNASAKFLTPGEVSPGFAIKLVSPSGQPLSGLQVEFMVDSPVAILLPAGAPPPPPAGLYGRFDAPNGWVETLTDQDGIARSGPFIAGTASGTYKVTASVYVTFYPANRVLISPPGPSVSFDVTQSFDALGARLTQRCNTGASSQILLYKTSAQAQTRIAAAVSRPETDLTLYDRLWRPLDARSGSDYVVLHMEQFQDIREIMTAIRADPLIASLGITSASDNGGVCLSALGPPPYQRVTEYHNTVLNHYFLSSTTEENAHIDSGGAGPGWMRTGESFQTIHPNVCYGSQRVFRFYGPGPNSHFYTADPNECGGLRTQKSGWIPEGVAFGARQPQNGVCTDSGYTPVYRLYNNRWMFNDSNHRYTIRTDIYQQMIARGWVGEGVALCVRNGA